MTNPDSNTVYRRALPDAPRKATRRWLLFVHQLPSTPSNLRVRTWRRLQQLGAIAVKQAVYILPDSPGAREDFEWLKAEIKGAGGEATVFAADSVDAWSDDELVEEFRRLRQEAYAKLAGDVEPILRQSASSQVSVRGSRRLLENFKLRLAAIEAIDFFGSAGRDRVVSLLEQVEARLISGAGRLSAKSGAAQRNSKEYRGRLWVTRLHPGVDRMASAWLIRHFIDPEASFDFVQDREAAPPDSIPFDMFGVEFSHLGERCTFETLCHTFRIGNAAVSRLAGIVHDLDLKDGRFGSPEVPVLGTVIEGLQLGFAADDALLAQGIVLFEALYQAFERSARRIGPRPMVTRNRRARIPPKRKSK